MDKEMQNKKDVIILDGSQSLDSLGVLMKKIGVRLLIFIEKPNYYS